MTTFTDKELIKEIKERISSLDVRDNIERRAYEIALASLEVEPIGFRCRRNDNLGDWSYVYHREPDDFERKHLVIEGIYAAPPAPVPLTEVQRAMLRDMDVEISAELEEEEEIYRDGIRKCIAALRYHHKRAETCSNGYTGSTLEEDTLKSINFLKRNNIAAMLQGANVSHTHEGKNHPEDKLGMVNHLGDANEKVNSPVTPDGWISCSERMPEDTKMLLAFSQGEIVAAYWNWVVNPIDYKKYRAFTYLSGNILDDVTHWMPLPEPPQEVK
ncbi:DUF551 domain-containing protein [Escherichia coli]|nr:DUF551 domain-containing protein [Escherichia coli]EII7584041.1 DUF551 domain-containing protein [Escherichia coli]EIJ5647242.1 DUF551 domain-containing protein [Escherichia coli]EIN2903415.1 DUF551 domain-containing protein [Escherichia coli]EIO7118635.1 DUF551 domain-containing protein [Escherichia coli]